MKQDTDQLPTTREPKQLHEIKESVKGMRTEFSEEIEMLKGNQNEMLETRETNK